MLNGFPQSSLSMDLDSTRMHTSRHVCRGGENPFWMWAAPSPKLGTGEKGERELGTSSQLFPDCRCSVTSYFTLQLATPSSPGWTVFPQAESPPQYFLNLPRPLCQAFDQRHDKTKLAQALRAFYKSYPLDRVIDQRDLIA